MAVFSNDPRAQALWDREKMLNLITSKPCPDTREQRTDLCRGDDEKRRRLGYAGCTQVETVKNDCQDYNRNVKAKAQTSADLAKYLKDTAKAKSDEDKKAAEFAAEQAILARRRASNASLESAVKTACVSTMNIGEPRRTAILEACSKAQTNFEKKKISVDNDIRVTFDEVARELSGSKASGKSGNKPSKLKKKLKAAKQALAKLKKKGR